MLRTLFLFFPVVAQASEAASPGVSAGTYLQAGFALILIVGLLAAALTGWLWVDALVALAVAVHICVQGVQLVWQSSQGLMDQALDAPQRLKIDTLLDGYAKRNEGVNFDNISSRQAGERSFVDFHMHVPGQWSVQRAAQLRSEIEAALLQAIPGLYARIELLPMGMNTVSEVADGEQGGEAQGAAKEGLST